MNRIPIIAGNWKMNKTIAQATELAKEVIGLTSRVEDVEIVVAPTFTALAAVRKCLEGNSVVLAAQNAYWEEKGAYTGEISPQMLLDAGCKYVIIGHSERRQYFGETDQTINKKLKAALSAGLDIIFCIGESLEEREAEKTLERISAQLKVGLEGLTEGDMSHLVIAYEPIWAIGTGKTASPAQAQEVHHFIRGWLTDSYGSERAEAIRIQYGGSVNPSNVAEIMAQPDIDGALVGGASLDGKSFSQLVKFGHQE